MNICFLITTYGRKESCQRLVDSLQGLGDIVVIGDGCGYTIDNCSFIDLSPHRGRLYYWDVVRRLFAHRGKHQYYFMLPDDFLPVPGMVESALEIWGRIEDPNKICLNLYTDRLGMSCWTKILPTDMGFVYKTGWVDMCFMAEERFFQNIKIKSSMTTRGSGVGAQISRKLTNKGFSFYQVKESLVIEQPEHWISQMKKEIVYEKAHRGIGEYSVTKRIYDTRSQKSRRPGRRSAGRA